MQGERQGKGDKSPLQNQSTSMQMKPCWNYGLGNLAVGQNLPLHSCVASYPLISPIHHLFIYKRKRCNKMMYKPEIPSAPGLAELQYLLLCPVGSHNFNQKGGMFPLGAGGCHCLFSRLPWQHSNMLGLQMGLALSPASSCWRAFQTSRRETVKYKITGNSYMPPQVYITTRIQDWPVLLVFLPITPIIPQVSVLGVQGDCPQVIFIGFYRRYKLLKPKIMSSILLQRTNLKKAKIAQLVKAERF